MVDPRWAVFARLRDAAVRDLSLAVRLWDGRTQAARSGPDGAAVLDKALQKALQDGYASLERAAEAVLDLAREPRPTGRRWHEDLLVMATSATASRPAFAPGLLRDLTELRRFRHVAVHGYDGFETERAAPAVEAARRVVAALPDAFGAFGRAFGLLDARPP